MLAETLRAAWVEINLSNLEYNIASIREKVGETEIIGMVKADAYGHGAAEVSRVLLENGVSTLAVATLSEGIALREQGFTCPILILGLTPYVYHSKIIEYDLIPTVTSYPNVRLLSKQAVSAGKKLEILIAVETGMGRIGFVPCPGSITEIEGITHLPNIEIKGLCSHFSTADEADQTFALKQLETFEAFTQQLIDLDIPITYRSHANSAAIMALPQSYYEAVRPGIVLYGCYPSDQVDKTQLSIKPVMEVKASLVYVKKVPAGTPISYGASFVTERKSLIGTLPLGYADGLSRTLSGKGRVIINGCYAPIVGQICMDQCMVDVTDVPDVKQYDDVVVMGTAGDKAVTADEIAEKTGTISYEVVCRFGQRLPKVFIREEAQ